MSTRSSIGVIWLAASVAFAQTGRLDSRSTMHITLPEDAPVSVMSADWGESNATPRGGALLLDLRTSLVLKNTSQRRLRGITLLVMVVIAVVGAVLWFALHESGIHATLAGVVLAAATPTRPPANLHALLAQAQAVIDAETRFRGDAMMQTGPSEPALRALDNVHDRIESPASKLLRATEPWSSYFVLPIFALANAGLVWSADVLTGRERLVVAIAVALVLGKFSGVFLGARIAVAAGVAVGLLAALAATRPLAAHLFGVTTLDAPTFGAMAVLMLAIGGVAAYLPARRASRVDPCESLRSD